MAKKLSARLWAWIAYPESMPEDWQNIVEGWHIPVIVSPLHDCDVDSNGELKKPHYHMMCVLNGSCSIDKMLEITETICVRHVEKLLSRMSYERYLCHLDSPDKYQYDVAQVQCFGGIRPQFLLDEEFRDGAVALYRLIDSRGFTVFDDFCKCVFFEYPELLGALARYNSLFNNICRSRWEFVKYNGVNSDSLSYVKYRVHILSE